jgi:hypothetical protein
VGTGQVDQIPESLLTLLSQTGIILVMMSDEQTAIHNRDGAF